MEPLPSLAVLLERPPDFAGVLKRESDAFTLLANLDTFGFFRYAQ